MNKLNELLNKGFKKVDKRIGGGFVSVVLFNPSTQEVESITVDDLEYQEDVVLHFAKQYGCSREALDRLRIAPNDEYSRLQYDIFTGVIKVGAVVEVVRGRKIKKGYTGKVVNMFDYNGSYGRTLTTYVVFGDGQKTSVRNCKRIG